MQDENKEKLPKENAHINISALLKELAVAVAQAKETETGTSEIEVVVGKLNPLLNKPNDLTEIDKKELIRLLDLAAQFKLAIVQNMLGFCYQNGIGVDKDAKKAVPCYRLAAEQGSAVAQACLGLCYANGYGVEKDAEKAVSFYRLSAKQGNAAAQANLGLCYDNGDGVEKDAKKAVSFYRLSANKGNAVAQANLGLCYEDGNGVNQDIKAAIYFYRLAARQGNARAQNNLGLCYSQGSGVEKDVKEAVRLLRLAAHKGIPQALYGLARCYSESSEFMTEEYSSEFIHLLRRAVVAGNEDAIELLKIKRSDPKYSKLIEEAEEREDQALFDLVAEKKYFVHTKEAKDKVQVAINSLVARIPQKNLPQKILSFEKTLKKLDLATLQKHLEVHFPGALGRIIINYILDPEEKIKKSFLDYFRDALNKNEEPRAGYPDNFFKGKKAVVAPDDEKHQAQSQIENRGLTPVDRGRG